MNSVPVRPEQALLDALAGLPGLVVAYSGGADSALVLAAAARTLGPQRVLAATAVSASLPQAELGPAQEFAAALGVEHRLLVTHELDRPGYRANDGQRCYFCKAELLDVVADEADRRGWPVATGTNADDLAAGFRPGIRAGMERGARTPLAEAGLTKNQVRELSQTWGLPTWDKPAAACLSSRIAYGIQITPTRLARVERAETAVREALADRGLDVRLIDLRVRDLGDRARLELDQATLDAVAGAKSGSEPWRDLLGDHGFTDVDLAPFRSGSLNDALRR